LFFYKVSSISKKRKDELGKMILGNDVLTKWASSLWLDLFQT
jgi:hypothetical protein